MKEVYLGAPIQKMIVAKTEGFSFNAFENIFVYLYSSNAKTVKMSVLPIDGYLPLTIVSDTELKIEVPGEITKTMGIGEIKIEFFHDSDNDMSNLLGGSMFGTELINNKIKSEV